MGPVLPVAAAFVFTIYHVQALRNMLRDFVQAKVQQWNIE